MSKMRREEAGKFILAKAEYENHIKLEASWTKGSRERVIPIMNETQRELLNEIRNYAPRTSLVPSHLSFKQYISHRK